jgi:hypothetical protein
VPQCHLLFSRRVQHERRNPNYWKIWFCFGCFAMLLSPHEGT